MFHNVIEKKFTFFVIQKTNIVASYGKNTMWKFFSTHFVKSMGKTLHFWTDFNFKCIRYMNKYDVEY